MIDLIRLILTNNDQCTTAAVYISNAGYAATASATAFPIAAAFAVPETKVNAGKKSALERMRELDQMKAYLTEDEYQRKRTEILSEV